MKDIEQTKKILKIVSSREGKALLLMVLSEIEIDMDWKSEAGQEPEVIRYEYMEMICGRIRKKLQQEIKSYDQKSKVLAQTRDLESLIAECKAEEQLKHK